MRPWVLHNPGSKIVGERGTVYAIDIHPLAIKKVQAKAEREGIGNIEAFLADATRTGLPDESVDVAFLFGFVHGTAGLGSILSELYRVLKAGGTLSIEKTPWLSGKKLVEAIERSRLVHSGNQGRVFLFRTKGGEGKKATAKPRQGGTVKLSLPTLAE